MLPIDKNIIDTYLIKQKEKENSFWSLIAKIRGAGSYFFSAFILLSMFIAIPLFSALNIPSKIRLIAFIVLFLALSPFANYIYHRLCDKKIRDLNLKLKNSFTPCETFIFSAAKLAKEFESRAKSKLPSDLGFGADLDDIGQNYFTIVSGHGYAHFDTVKTNSIFSGNVTAEERQELLSIDDWPITDEERKRAKIILESIAWFSQHAISKDHLLASNLLYKIIEVLIRILSGAFENIHVSLESIYGCICYYQDSRRQLLGLPLLTSIAFRSLLNALWRLRYLIISLVLGIAAAFFFGWLKDSLSTIVTIAALYLAFLPFDQKK